MKKKISLLIMIIVSMFFISCDDSLPEVTTQQAIDAYVAAWLASYAGDNEAGVDVAVDTSDSFRVEYTSYDLSDMYEGSGLTVNGVIQGDQITGVYNSVSGAMYWNTDGNIYFDMTLSGGAVITIYISEVFETGELNSVIVNGHDMTNALKAEM